MNRLKPYFKDKPVQKIIVNNAPEHFYNLCQGIKKMPLDHLKILVDLWPLVGTAIRAEMHIRRNGI